MTFTKKSLTILEQIDSTKSKYNINITDEKLAHHYFSHCNYYKLRGYWLFYEEMSTLNIDFEKVVNLYEFDRELRNTFLKHIERVESSIKSIFTNYLTVKYKDSHIHTKEHIFENKLFYQKSYKQLVSSFSKSTEIYAKHFKKKYDEPLPPLWVSVEMMTFGEISKWYKNLNIKDRKEIAKKYNLKERILTTFLFHLTEVRNISAHHSRLWNKKLSKGFQVPSNLKIYPNDNFKVYHTMIMLDYLLYQIGFNNKKTIIDEIVELLNKYNIPLKYMGFPKENTIKGLENIKYE